MDCLIAIDESGKSKRQVPRPGLGGRLAYRLHREIGFGPEYNFWRFDVGSEMFLYTVLVCSWVRHRTIREVW